MHRCSSARWGVLGRASSEVPKQTEIASLSVMQVSQWPRSPAVEIPRRRSAFLMVLAKEALDWGCDRKATSTVVPRSERKHVCSAQFADAQRWSTGTSWSRSSSFARKAFDVAVNADIRLTPRTISSTSSRSAATIEQADIASTCTDMGARRARRVLGAAPPIKQNRTQADGRQQRTAESVHARSVRDLHQIHGRGVAAPHLSTLWGRALFPPCIGSASSSTRR